MGAGTQEEDSNATRETLVGDWPRTSQPDAREGQTGPARESERFVVPLKPSNVGGGKGPQFKTSVESGDSWEIGDEPTTSDGYGWETTDGTAYQSEG